METHFAPETLKPSPTGAPWSLTSPVLASSDNQVTLSVSPLPVPGEAAEDERRTWSHSLGPMLFQSLQHEGTEEVKEGHLGLCDSLHQSPGLDGCNAHGPVPKTPPPLVGSNSTSVSKEEKNLC